MPQPYKVFTIYAREDALYLSELLGQLRPLEIANRIKVWSDREINPGVEWEKEIVAKLDTADIILILVSAAYYNSVYIHEVEIKYALSRHERGEARVLPLIVRPCSFLDDPIISRLQVLPTDGKPVTDRRHWQERDDAWLDVVAGVKRTLDSLLQAELMRMEAALSAERERQQESLITKENAELERMELKRQKKDQEHTENEQQSNNEPLHLEKEQAEKVTEHQTQLEVHPTDSEAWQQAANTNSYDSYQAYLKQFPKGDFALAAQYRLKGLHKRENGQNPSLANRIIILSGIVWGVVEFYSHIVSRSWSYSDGIVDEYIYTFSTVSISVGVLSIFTSFQFLKNKTSYLFTTLKAFIYLGIKIKMIMSAVAMFVLLFIFRGFLPSGIVFLFCVVFFSFNLIFGAIIGWILGLMYRTS